MVVKIVRDSWQLQEKISYVAKYLNENLNEQCCLTLFPLKKKKKRRFRELKIDADKP